MSLSRSEWLSKAQKVPVGQSRRVYHNDECRPNLVVYNNGDSWSAYCHRCHTTGYVRKEHAVVQPPKQRRVMPWPIDAKPFNKLDSYEQTHVAKFLSTKGIDFTQMCNDEYTWYSARTRRILFGTRLGWIGRTDCNAEPKWCNYQFPSASYAIHPQQKESQIVVLSEDYLSALKISWALPDVEPIALLGTRIGYALLSVLCERQPTAILGFFDGDKAGDEADVAVGKRLRGLGLNYKSVVRSDGYDPKDHTANELRIKIQEVLR